MDAVTEAQIRVMVVDDHPIVLEGMKAVLARAHGIEVVAAATGGADALVAAGQTRPDVVLLDLEIPPPAGPELIRELASVCSARVLIMTVMDDDGELVGCMRAGAAGYLLKGTAIDEVLHAITLVHAGEVSLTPALTRRLLARMAGGESTQEQSSSTVRVALTPREREVLTHVMRGGSNREISARMFLSPRTVKAHLATAFEKLNVHDRTAAVSVALAHGLIELEFDDAAAKVPEDRRA